MDAIVALMNAAFLNDPTARWVIADEAEFLRVHERLVHHWAGPVIDGGHVHVLGDFSAAAVWHPPGFKNVFDVEPLMAMCTERQRFERFLDVLDACEAHRPAGDYWELYLLAVEPAGQSSGAGARLLTHGLGICAGTGHPVYLESSNARNLGFYRRHGFRLLAEVALDGAPARFPMLRDAG